MDTIESILEEINNNRMPNAKRLYLPDPTKKRILDFLDSLSYGNRKDACEKLGVSFSNIHSWKKQLKNSGTIETINVAGYTPVQDKAPISNNDISISDIDISIGGNHLIYNTKDKMLMIQGTSAEEAALSFLKRMVRNS